MWTVKNKWWSCGHTHKTRKVARLCLRAFKQIYGKEVTMTVQKI
jgi:hypothetical protein